jgi:hypothetical protein
MHGKGFLIWKILVLCKMKTSQKIFMTMCMLRVTFVVNGTILKQVKDFKYLGCRNYNREVNRDSEENIIKYKNQCDTKETSQ